MKTLTYQDIAEWHKETQDTIHSYCGKYEKKDVNLAALVDLVDKIRSSDDKVIIKKYNNILKFFEVIPSVLTLNIDLIDYRFTDNLEDIKLDELRASGIIKKYSDIMPLSNADSIKEIIEGINNDDLSFADKKALLTFDHRTITLFTKDLSVLSEIAVDSFLNSDLLFNMYELGVHSYDHPANNDYHVKKILEYASYENKKKMLEDRGGLIEYIQNPSIELKRIALESDPECAEYCPGLDEDDYFKAIEHHPHVVHYLDKEYPRCIKYALSRDYSILNNFKYIHNEEYQIIGAKNLVESQQNTDWINVRMDEIMNKMIKGSWQCTKYLRILADAPALEKWHNQIKKHPNYKTVAEMILVEVDKVNV